MYYLNPLLLLVILPHVKSDGHCFQQNSIRNIPYYCWLHTLKRATLVTHVSMAENRQASGQEHNRHGQIIVIPSVQQLDGVLDQAVLGAA